MIFSDKMNASRVLLEKEYTDLNGSYEKVNIQLINKQDMLDRETQEKKSLKNTISTLENSIYTFTEKLANEENKRILTQQKNEDLQKALNTRTSANKALNEEVLFLSQYIFT